MKLFAWLSQWAHGWRKPAEPTEASQAFDEDHSSMAELVSILARIDRLENSRAAR